MLEVISGFTSPGWPRRSMSAISSSAPRVRSQSMRLRICSSSSTPIVSGCERDFPARAQRELGRERTEEGEQRDREHQAGHDLRAEPRIQAHQVLQ